MVSALIGRLHPDAEKVDGAGGDGGRDVLIHGPAGLVIFELKSFTGRLTSSRKNQVRQSLRRATAHSPVEWNLVVPIDPTPAEMDWFDRLRTEVACPIRWLGKNWLDREFAARPEFQRYFLEGAADEAVRMLTEIHQEETALAHGVPDAMERLQRLMVRANELDPYYRFELASDGATTSVNVVPRYHGAERDRPITASFVLTFPDTERGRAARVAFEEAEALGTPTVIPAEFVSNVRIDMPAGLGGEFDSGTLEALPVDLSGVPPWPVELACVDPEGAVTARLRLDMRVVSRGREGAVLEGFDRASAIRCGMTLRLATSNVRLRVEVRRPTEYLPHELLPGARFLAEFHAPNRMRIVRPPDEMVLGEVTEIPGEDWIEPRFVEFVADMALVQLESGQVQPVPMEMLPEDLIRGAQAGLLLRGGALQVTWNSITFTLGTGSLLEQREALRETGHRLRLESREPAEFVIFGQTYRIGRGQVTELESAKLRGRLPKRALAPVLSEPVKVTLVPDATNLAEIRLVR